jgi:hypothetical protein
MQRISEIIAICSSFLKFATYPRSNSVVNSNLGNFTIIMLVNEENYIPIHNLFIVYESISSYKFARENISIQSIPTQGNSLTMLENCF